MTRVKICGCRTEEQALAAAGAGADFIGLVFTESRRKVSREEASAIVRALGAPLGEIEMVSPPALFRETSSGLRSWFEHGAAALERLLERKRPLTVGVFADNDIEEINETVDECGIDLIQLSGGEPWSACLGVNRQVVRTVHVGEDAAAALAGIETGSALAVHLDSAGALRGGSGRAFDWSLAARIADELPLWLAGGLTPENVGLAIRTVRPWCVDVSSGVETDGIKDAEKIRAFVKAAREVDKDADGEGR